MGLGYRFTKIPSPCVAAKVPVQAIIVRVIKAALSCSLFGLGKFTHQQLQPNLGQIFICQPQCSFLISKSFFLKSMLLIEVVFLQQASTPSKPYVRINNIFIVLYSIFNIRTITLPCNTQLVSSVIAMQISQISFLRWITTAGNSCQLTFQLTNFRL